MNPTNENNKQILNIPIEDIIPNRFQPRLSFDENGLKELASSIKEHGIIQPLVLRRLSDKYEIVAGERRYKAAKMAGLTSVPAIITEMDDKKSAEVAIVENVQRRDLSSIEEAKSYKALLDKGYLTQEELAKKMGLSQSAISNKLRLLSLAPSVQEALVNGKISERHARSLLVLDDLKEQEEWLEKLINERLTVKELDKRLAEIKKNKEEDIIPIEEVVPKVKEEIPNQNEEVIFAKKNKGIPNTFFNFLENESVNMGVSDNNLNNSIIKEPEINEVKEVSEANEEIEMLDFLAPEPPKKDMELVNSLVDELLKTLTSKNYQVLMNKDETTKEVKYTITINKE